MIVIALVAAGGLTPGQSPLVPREVQLVVAVPTGVEASPALVARIEGEMRLAVGWLEAQTGGELRMASDEAVVVQTALPDRPLTGTNDHVAGVLQEQWQSGRLPVGVLPVIVTTLGRVSPQGERTMCGLGSPLAVQVFLGNCDAPSDGTFGSLVSRTIAHELVHAMGAVAGCAPHGHDGHVTDDPRDLMYEGHDRAAGEPVLDVGNDDYWQHGRGRCPDIMDSPLWR